MKKDTIKTEESKKEEEVVLNKDDQKQVTIIERVIENREIMPHDAFGKLNRAQLELVKRTYAKGANDDELYLFITVCHGLQLSPFSKQVHLVPRWDSKEGKEVRQIQVGIDGFRASAEKTGKYAGNDDAVYEGEKIIELGEKKEKLVVPEKATVTVWKIVEGGRYAFTASARWPEYYPGPKMGFQWNKKPYLMLAKCAEALALRKGFPALLSGIYTPEELDRGQTDTSGQQNTETGLKRVLEMIEKASVVELEELKRKVQKTTKYDAKQKADLLKAIEDQFTKLDDPTK